MLEKRVYGKKDSENILIQVVDDHDLKIINNEINYINNNVNKDFKLITFKVKSWNNDLSPWEANNPFNNKKFGLGASNTLKEILNYCKDKNKKYYLGGYSLSGLFALYSSYLSEVFLGIASCSPSIWFDNFINFMKENKIKCKNVYLSLGNKEHKTKNIILSSVKEKIYEAYKILNDNKINCILEFNEGNHFVNSDIRIAKGFSYLLNNTNN